MVPTKDMSTCTSLPLTPSSFHSLLCYEIWQSLHCNGNISFREETFNFIDPSVFCHPSYSQFSSQFTVKVCTYFILGTSSLLLKLTGLIVWEIICF